MNHRTDLPSGLSRRDALRALVAGLALAGLPLAAAASSVSPDVEATLAAFVATVVPGVTDEDDDPVRAMTDEELPLSDHVGLLVRTLDRRAGRAFGRPFRTLEPPERAEVLRAALASRGPLVRLFRGAVLVVQVAYFGGLYHPERGCPAIGFDGAYRFAGFAPLTFPNPAEFLARSLTPDGNPCLEPPCKPTPRTSL